MLSNRRCLKCRNLREYFNNPSYGDVCVIAGKHRFYASKMLLASHSQVLKDTFTSEKQDNKSHKSTLQLTHITADTDHTESFLLFFYDIEPTLTINNFRTIHLLSIEYKVRGLYQLCLAWLDEKTPLYLNMFNEIPPCFYLDVFNADPIHTAEYISQWFNHSTQNYSLFQKNLYLVSDKMKSLKTNNSDVYYKYFSHLQLPSEKKLRAFHWSSAPMNHILAVCTE